MLLIASRSVTQGRAAGFASLLGAQAGTYGHAVAAALGLSQLLAVPLAYDALRYAGAAYLLALTWTAFRSKGPDPTGTQIAAEPQFSPTLPHPEQGSEGPVSKDARAARSRAEGACVLRHGRSAPCSG